MVMMEPAALMGCALRRLETTWDGKKKGAWRRIATLGYAVRSNPVGPFMKRVAALLKCNSPWN
jgi:hypothetical protein